MSFDDVKVLVCRVDFYRTLANALRECGGNPSLAPNMSGWTFREVVNVLAQNGIRMVYVPEKHMDRILEALQ